MSDMVPSRNANNVNYGTNPPILFKVDEKIYVFGFTVIYFMREQVVKKVLVECSSFLIQYGIGRGV